MIQLKMETVTELQVPGTIVPPTTKEGRGAAGRTGGTEESDRGPVFFVLDHAWAGKCADKLVCEANKTQTSAVNPPHRNLVSAVDKWVGGHPDLLVLFRGRGAACYPTTEV